jgi:thiol-disulfide isomerase/thioredoxin
MPLARRELLALGAIGAVAAVGGAVFGVLGLQSKSGAAALLAAPFVDLQGSTTRLRDWPSRVVLCNFWATWCEPCREEVPLLIAAEHQFRDKGLEVAGIGFDNVGKLREFAETFAVNYRILIGPAGTPDLLRMLGDEAAALPFSVVLNAQRRIVHRKLGAWSKSELDREILAAMG